MAPETLEEFLARNRNPHPPSDEQIEAAAVIHRQVLDRESARDVESGAA